MLDSKVERYCQYLICGNGQASATTLEEVTDRAVSHDEITRFLANSNFDNVSLWKRAKHLIREYEKPDGCLILDDTYYEKPYMDENEIICKHYDHSRGRFIKGVNILTLLYTSEATGENFNINVPLGISVIAKTEGYIDDKTGKEKRRSPDTKHYLGQGLIKKQAIRNKVRFKYVLADKWFCTAENMKFVDQLSKKFIFAMPSNRLAAKTLKDKRKGEFQQIGEMNIPKDLSTKIYISGLSFPVRLIKCVFKNKDGSKVEMFLVTNDSESEASKIQELYRRRWGIEEYHKSLKQNCSISKSPARRVRSQINHIFLSLFSYLKLEELKARCKKKVNHFRFKAMLYAEQLKVAMENFSMFYAEI
jgi:hypothetical protein